MKRLSLEFPTARSSIQNTPKLLLLSTACLVLITIIPLYFLLFIPSILWSTLKTSSPSSSDHSGTVESYKKCDIFIGEWVPNPLAPYYTNTTCWAIHNYQNCMKYGRPDTDFLKWRWKPDDCELPIFNPAQFLELVRGKSMAFIGDSVGRNQMQSLICLLSRVEYPVDVTNTPDEQFNRWFFTSYNFTVANFRSPFLVKSKERDPNGPKHIGPFNLYLDTFDTDWTTQIDEFDYIILSAGHWFFRSSVYYEGSKTVGCNDCLENNITDLGPCYGYRQAFRTAFRAINGMKSFKGITFLRTFAPSHFENGPWNEGGNCVRKKPFGSNETRLEGINLEFYITQVEELRVAERVGKERGLKFKLLDTTRAALLRPDGHPGPYGHLPNENVVMVNDCVHWCLPGPIDTWNDFLLQMLKMEGGAGSFDKRLHKIDRKLKSI